MDFIPLKEHASAIRVPPANSSLEEAGGHDRKTFLHPQKKCVFQKFVILERLHHLEWAFYPIAMSYSCSMWLKMCKLLSVDYILISEKGNKFVLLKIVTDRVPENWVSVFGSATE